MDVVKVLEGECRVFIFILLGVIIFVVKIGKGEFLIFCVFLDVVSRVWVILGVIFVVYVGYLVI